MAVHQSDDLSVYAVKKIDILSLAKMLGALHAAIGLIMGLLMSIASLTGMVDPDRVLFGSAAVIFLPVVNFVLGFFGGALIAVIYNFIGTFFGGIKIYTHK